MGSKARMESARAMALRPPQPLQTPCKAVLLAVSKAHASPGTFWSSAAKREGSYPKGCTEESTADSPTMEQAEAGLGPGSPTPSSPFIRPNSSEWLCLVSIYKMRVQLGRAIFQSSENILPTSMQKPMFAHSYPFQRHSWEYCEAMAGLLIQGHPLQTASTALHTSKSPDPAWNPITLSITPVAAHCLDFLTILSGFGHLQPMPVSSVPPEALCHSSDYCRLKKQPQWLPCSLPLKRQTEPLTAHMGAHSSTCCELIFT